MEDLDRTTNMGKGKRTLYRYWTSEGIITDSRLLQAFMRVPRENFVRGDDISDAYGDHPLTIHAGQTISQPTTVMMMTQALQVKEGQKVLEIGTGSGYQSAILSEMVGNSGQVYSIEYFYDLVQFAKKNLSLAGYPRVKVINGDGGDGHPQQAPYDRIIVTCAVPHILEPLKNQLKIGGILVLPVTEMLHEQMYVITRTEEGYDTDCIGSFSFVPLQGRYKRKENVTTL